MEQYAQRIDDDVQYEYEDDAVDIDRIHVDVERYEENEEQNRERERLTERREPFLVFVREKRANS